MDKLIYVAMTGAKHVMTKQATTTNNLANATTTGFKAQVDAFRAVPVEGAPLATRTYAVDSTIGADLSAGSMQQTGRDLDVAVEGEGWIAVQMGDGREAYTRNGNFKISENGVLQTKSGLNIMGESGPISIPPDTHLSIAKDGAVSAIDKTSTPASVNEVGKIKLVNPPAENMTRGDDGLFSTKDGRPAPLDPDVGLLSETLEGSNVNVAESMVEMISLARQFEMHMNMLKNADENASKASQLLSLS